MEENSNQRPSQRPPLPFRLSPLMRILLRMISEEVAALEPYFLHAYGTRHQDDYRPRPYNDPYHSRRRRPYGIPPRQGHYQDELPRIRPQDNPPICGRPDDHICGMHMYQDGPLPQNLPPLPQRQLPVPPLNPYINVNPNVNNNPDPNENQVLRRLLAARGRISPPQNPPNFYPDHNHISQYHNSQPQSPPPLNTQFQNSNHQSRFKNSFHNQYPYNSYPPPPPPPHPQYQNYPQLHFQNSHPQPQMQNITYHPHFHNHPPLQNHPYTHLHNHPPHPPFRNAQIPLRFPPPLALVQNQNSGAHNQIPNTIPPTFQNTSPPPPFQNTTYFPPSPPPSYLTSTFTPTGVRNVQILDNLNEEEDDSE